MFIEKSEAGVQAIFADTTARLLFLNMLFVIAGYGLSTATGGASIAAVKIFKSLFLFGSLLYVILNSRAGNPAKYFDCGNIPIFFSILIILFCFNSNEIIEPLNRVQTFVVPFIYIFLSLTYLIARFGIDLILKGFHWALMWVYTIPLLSYVILGGNLGETNIYVNTGEDMAFAPNHYGWSSTLFILSLLFVWKNIELKTVSKVLFGGVLIIAFILFFTSANRSSWLSMSVTMLPFLFRFKGMKKSYKAIALLIALTFILYLLSDVSSSINFAINKSYRQQEEGEERLRVATLMYNYLNRSPSLWLSGIGVFNYEVIEGKSNLHSYHNSYWEVLFGIGIPLFLLFLTFMVFRPLIRFIKYYSKYTLLLAPLLIIPFFESNLTGGQFLFYPWFTFMLLLNAKIKFWGKPFQHAYKKRKEAILNFDILK